LHVVNRFTFGNRCSTNPAYLKNRFEMLHRELYKLAKYNLSPASVVTGVLLVPIFHSFCVQFVIVSLNHYSKIKGD
jgi:hypothetical protein